MQVSEKERDSLLQNTRKELISLVASRIVHPDTNRLFPIQSIEEAITDLGFDVKMNDSAKKQANFLIKELASRYFIKKADMEIKISIREEWISTGVDTGEDIQVEAPKKLSIDGVENEGVEGENEDDDHSKKKDTSAKEKKAASGPRKNDIAKPKADKGDHGAIEGDAKHSKAVGIILSNRSHCRGKSSFRGKVRKVQEVFKRQFYFYESAVGWEAYLTHLRHRSCKIQRHNYRYQELLPEVGV